MRSRFARNTLSFPLGLLLSSCLNNSLEVAPPDSPKRSIHTPKLKALEEDVHENIRLSYIQEFKEALSKNVSTDSREDELVRLLSNMNQNPEELALSVDELKLLQKLIIDGDIDLSQFMPESNPQNNVLNTPEEDYSIAQDKTLDLSFPQICVARKYEVKNVAGDLRLATSLQNPDSCGVQWSGSLEKALNKLLKGEELQWKFHPNSSPIKSRNLKEFFEDLENTGIQISVEYRIYLAPFLRLYQPEGDLYDPASEIPTPFWLNPKIKTENDENVMIPAPHSEVYFEFEAPAHSSTHHKALGRIKIYYSDKGFQFDDDDLHIPAWAGKRTLYRFEHHEHASLIKNIESVRETFETFKNASPKELPLYGFGVLGVCNDGAAFLMRVLKGQSFIAPYPLIRTDRIQMPENFTHKKEWFLFPSDTWSSYKTTRINFIKRLLESNPFDANNNPYHQYKAHLDHLASEIQENEESSP